MAEDANTYVLDQPTRATLVQLGGWRVLQPSLIGGGNPPFILAGQFLPQFGRSVTLGLRSVPTRMWFAGEFQTRR